MRIAKGSERFWVYSAPGKAGAYRLWKSGQSTDTKYGKNFIKDYSNKLTNKFGKKYTVSLLYKIKQFYSIIEKVPTLSGKLTWSHWYEMLSINDIDKISYYVHQCEINNIDVRGLRNIIKSNEYERLPEFTKNKLMNHDESNLVDFVKSYND